MDASCRCPQRIDNSAEFDKLMIDRKQMNSKASDDTHTRAYSHSHTDTTDNGNHYGIMFNYEGIKFKICDLFSIFSELSIGTMQTKRKAFKRKYRFEIREKK